MKKIIAFVLTIASIFTLTGCSNDSKYLQEISLTELYTMVENEETFILEISQDGCSHCAKFNPVFIKVLEKYQVTARYLNVSNISEKEFDKFLDDFNSGESMGTPTVLFITNGHEKTSMNRLVGEPSENEIIRKLKQNEYIKD